MESFCATQKEGPEKENRGRKALHETLVEMAECIQSAEEAHGAGEFLLAEQGRDVQRDKPDKRLRFVRLHASGWQPGKRTQQTASLG